MKTMAKAILGVILGGFVLGVLAGIGSELMMPSTQVLHNMPVVSPLFPANRIRLSASNTLTLRGPVTDESMTKLSRKLLGMSNMLPASATIYLVMQTPGGDIDAGRSFIDFAHAIPQKINTITLFSASMGFHIVQNLGERYVTPSGKLMSHRAFLGGLEGQVPGEFITRLSYLMRVLAEMDMSVADRVDMPLDEYQALIKDEYWVSGQDAVDAHMADSVVVITCDKTLSGEDVETYQTFFGRVKVTYSACPAITAPLDIEGAIGGRKEVNEMYSSKSIYKLNALSRQLN